MSVTNLLLLQILRSKKNSMPLNEIVKGFRELGMSKPPTKTSIYANLQKLATKKHVEINWEENNKFYRLSTIGLDELVKVEMLLKVK
jgi:DNA-binding PadR family transcriptional regulator